MRKSALLLFFVLTALVNNAQVTWEKLFSGKSTDVFRSVAEVPSGGYVVAGYTSDSTVNDTDAVVLRLTAAGDTSWTYRYNGPASRKDLFYKVINTADGGFALCGYSTSGIGTGGQDDYFYLKLNGSGVLQWSKIFGGTVKDRAQDIIQTSDGGYALCGYSTSPPSQYYDAMLIRTNSTGDTLWTKRFGTSVYDDANSLQQLSDGGFIMGGQSQSSASNYDQYLVRTNSSGGLIWSTKIGTPLTDNIECIRTVSGGFVLAGSTNTVANGDNGYIVKIDTGGTVIWSKSFGGSLPDDFHRIESTSDGGFIATGTTSSTGPNLPNMWLMKTNASGDSLWSRAPGGSNHDHGYSGQQTSDGGYIICGHTGSFGFLNEEGYIVKLDGSGNGTNRLTYTTVTGIITAASGGCGVSSSQIRVAIRNFGNESVPNRPITVTVSGAATQTINQTFSGTFQAGDVDTLTLTTTLNTTSGGTFNISASINNTNDVWPARNSYTISRTYGSLDAAPVGTPASNCGAGSVNLTATSTGTIYWFTAASGGTQVGTGATYTTPVIPSTTTYYAQSNLICPSTRTAVVATINPAAADPVTTGDDRCGTGTLTLNATASDPVSWYDQVSGGSSLHTGSSFTTPSLSTTTTYYAQASNGNCFSNRIATTATVSQAAADPVTTGGFTCGTGTVVLAASSPDSVFWYAASSGGSPLDTGLTFTTPSISSNTTYYAQADNGCNSARVPALATVSSPASAPTTTDGENCGQGSVVLQAASSDSVVWYAAATGGTPLDTGNTFTTPVIPSTTTYYAEANNGGCASTRVAAVATIIPLPIVDLGPDVFMSGGTYISNAGAGFTTYSWSNGATTQSITIGLSDTYCVTVTDTTGCTNQDCIVVNLNVGIASVSDSKKFSLFPNPSAGLFTIELKTPVEDAKIEIMNLTGSVVKTYNNDLISKQNIDLANFPKGIYVVKIIGKNYSAAQRVILQ